LILEASRRYPSLPTTTAAATDDATDIHTYPTATAITTTIAFTTNAAVVAVVRHLDSSSSSLAGSSEVPLDLAR
jgi:hypothetical protein